MTNPAGVGDGGGDAGTRHAGAKTILRDSGRKARASAAVCAITVLRACGGNAIGAAALAVTVLRSDAGNNTIASADSPAISHLIAHNGVDAVGRQRAFNRGGANSDASRRRYHASFHPGRISSAEIDAIS